MRISESEFRKVIREEVQKALNESSGVDNEKYVQHLSKEVSGKSVKGVSNPLKAPDELMLSFQDGSRIRFTVSATGEKLRLKYTE